MKRRRIAAPLECFRANASIVAALLIAIASCASDATCGEGTVLEGSECIPKDDMQASSGPDGVADVPADAEPSSVEEVPASARGGCPTSSPGPALIEVNGPDGALCIDSTEVTQAQYAEFLLDSADTEFDSQLELCAGNTTFLPQGLGTNAETGCPLSQPFNPEERPDDPVVCIDWCDAEAYCSWAGKRLCGGTDGALLVSEDDSSEEARRGVLDATTTEFLYVCSEGGKSAFNYGNRFEEDRCSDDRVRPVGSCEGPEWVFDLIGNVAEWSALCGIVDESRLLCFAVGGGSLGADLEEMPDEGCYQARLSNGAPGFGRTDVGFRCCDDIR